MGYRFATFAVLLFSATTARAACPDWIDQQMKAGKIPACPKSDNTILDETYPAMAQVVSDMPQVNTSAAQAMTADYVEEVLKASGDRVPMLILPVKQATYDFVEFKVRELAAKPEYAAYKDRWLKALVHVPTAKSWTWQQDYFESFIDPATGMPVLRGVRDYGRAGNSVDQIASTGKGSCGLLSGGPTVPPKTEKNYKYQSAHSGGNIEALPGGLCLHGSNQAWENYAKYYCGDRKNETVIDSSWLRVGHADEIVGTVKKPKAAAPCDFAITLASPAKALELMRAKPKEKFAAFHSSTGTNLDHRYNSNPMQHICMLAKMYMIKEAPGDFFVPPKPNKNKAGSATGMLLRRLDSALLAEARAEGGNGVTDDDCKDLTNGQVAKFIAQDLADTGLLNKLIDEKMQETKKTIRDKLKERLPQCTPDFIEVPDLFYSDFSPTPIPGAKSTDPLTKRYAMPADEKGNSAVDSVMPNPTNGVLVENTMISPHPQNDAFKSYLDKAYGDLGLKHTTVDTFDYAHVGYGNLHCSSHSIRFCGGPNAQP